VQSDLDRDLERRLVAARPEPPAGFVDELEAALFRPPRAARARPRPRRAWHPMFAAGAAAAALGAVVLVLSLLGLSPLQRGGGDPVSAEGCQTVLVPRTVIKPTLILGDDGQLRVEDRKVREMQQVKRCP
jgi:hypothetical protein